MNSAFVRANPITLPVQRYSEAEALLRTAQRCLEKAINIATSTRSQRMALHLELSTVHYHLALVFREKGAPGDAETSLHLMAPQVCTVAMSGGNGGNESSADG